MNLPTPLVRGTLLRRYKRFLADVQLNDGTFVTAACPNTGTMLGLCAPGQTIWLSTSDKPSRKFRHTWELVDLTETENATLVGVNTGHPNKIVAEAITLGQLDTLSGYSTLEREKNYGVNSRIDIRLSDPAKPTAFVEVKNVHMSRRRDRAEFPDCVTERGMKHLHELAAMVGEGYRAVMIFLIQRTDVSALSLARDVDPKYGAAFDRARAAGVEMLALRCALTTDAIIAEKLVPILEP